MEPKQHTYINHDSILIRKGVELELAYANKLYDRNAKEFETAAELIKCDRYWRGEDYKKPERFMSTRAEDILRRNLILQKLWQERQNPSNE